MDINYAMITQTKHLYQDQALFRGKKKRSQNYFLLQFYFKSLHGGFV